MDADLRAMLDAQVGDLERRIESVIAQTQTSEAKAWLKQSILGIGPVFAAKLIADLPELGRMTSGEAAAMTGLAAIPHHTRTMHGKRIKTARPATGLFSGRACRRLSQSGSETGRAAPHDARPAAQTCHRCQRARVGHHRKRNP